LPFFYYSTLKSIKQPQRPLDPDNLIGPIDHSNPVSDTDHHDFHVMERHFDFFRFFEIEVNRSFIQKKDFWLSPKDPG
jgi:hypothetical protein